MKLSNSQATLDDLSFVSQKNIFNYFYKHNMQYLDGDFLSPLPKNVDLQNCHSRMSEVAVSKWRRQHNGEAPRRETDKGALLQRMNQPLA